MMVITLIVIHWYISLFFQTFFLHRYASHNLYKMSPAWEKIFFFLTFIFQGSSFLHPGAYAMMHRKHHKYADTIEDPHTPQLVNNIFEFNKKTFVEYRKIVNQFNRGEINLKDVPRWPLLERLGDYYSTRILFILAYMMLYWIFSPSIWYFVFIPLHVFMGPIHGFIVNWFGHLIGYRNFNDLEDHSQNTLPVDFLMMGELYQNNHHKEPTRSNFSHKWFEVDLGYLIALLLQKMNIIQLNKVNKV